MGLLHEGRFLDVTIPFCVMIQNLLFVMKHPLKQFRKILEYRIQDKIQ